MDIPKNLERDDASGALVFRPTEKDRQLRQLKLKNRQLEAKNAELERKFDKLLDSLPMLKDILGE